MAIQARRRARMRGTTLVELLVVMALLAILVTLAGVGIAGPMGRHRAATAGSELIASLQHARSMALLRNRVASVCPSADRITCTGAATWQRGWIVFIDRDRDGRRDGDDPLIAATVPSIDGLRITASSGRSRVQFLPDGRAAGSTITFTICNTRDGGDGDHRVIVSNVGRIRRERAPC